MSKVADARRVDVDLGLGEPSTGRRQFEVAFSRRTEGYGLNHELVGRQPQGILSAEPVSEDLPPTVG